jgi:RNA polymerase sigma-70 factor (ECF subfamily)
MAVPSVSALEALPSSDPGTDDELVRRISAGESELYAVLMRRYNQRLYRIARGILGNDDEAEDVVQHAYVTAFQELRSFRGEASFVTWLTRIAVNEALGRVRRRHRGVVLVENDGGQSAPSPSPSPEESAYQHEMARLLEQQIDHLPEQLRVAFMLRDVEELSTREAAALLGISEAALRVRVHRARHLLQERLSSVMESAPDAFRFAGRRCDRIVLAVMRRIGVVTETDARDSIE